MDDRIAHEPQLGAMRSSIGWALLGLVIERPSYGYELSQRFKRIYGETLVLSSNQRIYTGLDTLRVRGLIEEAQGASIEAIGRRLPKPRYHATARGVSAYQDWLFAQIEEERRRHRLFTRQLAMLEPQAALEVIDQYEHECLSEADEATPAETEREAVAERLAQGEEQLNLEVRLSWIKYARTEFETLIGRRPDDSSERAAER